MAVSGATVQAGPAKRSISGRLDWASEQFRRIPVRWRIATIVILNLAFITLLMLLIASGARAIRSAWDDLQEARRIDRLLASIENDAGRLQTLIHRYFALPNETVLNEIEQRRKALLAKLAIEQGSTSPSPCRTGALRLLRHRALHARLRRAALGARDHLLHLRERDPQARQRALAALCRGRDGHERPRRPDRPSLGKSREAFSIFLVAINDYYLTQSVQAQREASRSIEVIQATARSWSTSPRRSSSARR